MKLTRQPELTRPVTIPALARKNGVPRRTLFRRLLMMHLGDRARGPEHTLWLFRHGSGPWSVNLSRLYAEHPEMFDAPTPEELQAQVAEIREYSKYTRRQVNALYATFHDHRRAHDEAENKARRRKMQSA